MVSWHALDQSVPGPCCDQYPPLGKIDELSLVSLAVVGLRMLGRLLMLGELLMPGGLLMLDGPLMVEGLVWPQQGLLGAGPLPGI